MIKCPTNSHITGSKMTPLQHHHVGRGILVHHPSGPQHYIASLRDCMELVTCPNECFVQVGFRNWSLHMHMCNTYVPSHEHAPTHATAQAPAPAHAKIGSTCVTRKWAMAIDIRPSHALPLCACGTHMQLHPNPLHCAEGSNHVTHSC
ncbi:hypothetical protein O181_003198 [Austropuccinia psidii MF-1]|uniref:Uncharacterized protein n=1 Tax=Austropuccinia psidii MF-1 TaxID=1389203 RepID=A0A9Q3BE74_9BASI|nr:hypothetical protein [Austropuccinia psidii MF-1]